MACAARSTHHSPLKERRGFEPPVPFTGCVGLFRGREGSKRSDGGLEPLFHFSGTDSSNPLRSSRESANHRFLSGARNIVRLRLPPWRTQSHPSRNCLTANSVTHLSGRFLRLGKSIMGEPKKVVAPKDSRHYREVASKLRGIARQSSLPVTRQKILDFALRFEGIAKQVDRRSRTGCRPEDAC